MNKKLFLAVATLLICFAPKAWAYDFSAKCESGQTLFYNITSNTKPYTVEVASNEAAKGDLVIPSTVAYNGISYSVTSIGHGVFYRCEDLSSVNIPNSVTEIGESAFYQCYGLTSITIPNSVTTIGDEAFRYCHNLASINIPSSATSIGNGAFGGCSYAKEIVVDSGNRIYDSRENCNAIIETATNTLIFGFNNTVIPNSVTSIGSYAFNECYGLTSITIPNSVTTIGESAFEGCDELTSVTIPNSVTSIGDYAFSFCRTLTSIKIPNSVTSIGKGAFWNCSGLKEPIYNANIFIYFPCGPCGYATDYTIPAGIQNIAATAFYSCKSLKSVTIPNSVTSIGDEAFYECLELTSINIPNSVTSIGNGAFYGCELPSINLPNSVKYIGKEAFEFCGLKSIVIPNSVTSIDDEAFLGCKSLKSVTIPSSVTSIGKDAFYGCDNITDITFESDITLSDADLCIIKDKIRYAVVDKKSVKLVPTIEWGQEKVFGDNYDTDYSDYEMIPVKINKCPYSLATITIPETITFGQTFTVTSIADSAFCGCHWTNPITSIIIPNSVTSIGYDAFAYVTNIVYNGNATGSPWGAVNTNGYAEGYLVYSDKSKQRLIGCNHLAEDITIPKTVTSIGERAFYNCSKLTSCTIPSSVTEIGDKAFYHCGELASITIPNSVTKIGYNAFYWCSKLTSINIPNSVEEIGDDAFSSVGNIVYSGTATGSPWGADMVNGYMDGYLLYSDKTKTHLIKCNALASKVKIPKSVTSIDYGALSDCRNLTSISVDKNNPQYDSRNNCNAIIETATNTLISGCKNTTILNSVSSIAELAFSGCEKLTTITIPNSVTSIGNGAFFNCSGLISIAIPNSVSNISDHIFQNCSSLTSITIPNSVTEIGEYAFYGCTGLTSIVIPNSVTSIGEEAFSRCSGLTSVNIPNSLTSIGKGAFYGCDNLPKETREKIKEINMEADWGW